ncbi:hypothetical protein [Planomonospora parontospora]|uniref:hypothetical protein n=1 Tax=Planomonospora parontospora TaxID=58119 RepID=UPI001670CC8E|nr:hypothetical protein [Planomonospora parontospora]GGL56522.1 hypothetical protein GCM10014719_67460 [Planomonospora parontospora subsp. antibiotica]GII19936.1 hypothetical protein Ppa05_66620 [Planomonospora parontospora subsp. antibiotica]
MEFLVVLTLAKAVHNGMRQATITRTVTAAPGSTREGLLSWALNEAGPEMAGSNIVFFSAEPNALPTSVRAVK